jgi:hypothetical protein
LRLDGLGLAAGRSSRHRGGCWFLAGLSLDHSGNLFFDLSKLGLKLLFVVLEIRELFLAGLMLTTQGFELVLLLGDALGQVFQVYD